MSLKDIGEFGLIGRINSMFCAPEGVTGIGDDCAILPQKDGKDTLVSTDMLVEGTHFLIDDISPRELGWKSAAVNLSDIAAMGGRPVGSFLSFALPPVLEETWIDEFIAGYKELSEISGAPLLGGDTTSSQDRICISVTVMGECVHGASKMRCGARCGDLVCVTGTLGDSAGGLKAVLDRYGAKTMDPDADADLKELVRRHYRPIPRLAEGLELGSIEGVHSMMDISDGIASDLGHILKASTDKTGINIGARINIASIPLSEALKKCCSRYGWDSLDLALAGGEDYELLFTASPQSLKAFRGIYYTIGEIIEGQGIEWAGSDRSFEGFRHF